MASNLKVLLMTNRSEYLIGQVTELDEEPSLLIEKCMKVNDDGSLEPYPKHTDQRDLFLTSDSVLTIVDASEEITKEYNAQNE